MTRTPAAQSSSPASTTARGAPQTPTEAGPCSAKRATRNARPSTMARNTRPMKRLPGVVFRCSVTAQTPVSRRSRTTGQTSSTPANTISSSGRATRASESGSIRVSYHPSAGRSGRMRGIARDALLGSASRWIDEESFARGRAQEAVAAAFAGHRHGHPRRGSSGFRGARLRRRHHESRRRARGGFDRIALRILPQQGRDGRRRGRARARARSARSCSRSWSRPRARTGLAAQLRAFVETLVELHAKRPRCTGSSSIRPSTRPRRTPASCASRNRWRTRSPRRCARVRPALARPGHAGPI